jgi:flavin reductase (DIM6/NTAB) family NADH-FMN oxidoreductase RutF
MPNVDQFDRSIVSAGQRFYNFRMALIDIPTIEAIKYLYRPKEEWPDNAPFLHRILLLFSVSPEGVPNTMPFGAWKEIALDPDGWGFIAYIHSTNYTHKLVMQTGVFTISVPPKSMIQKARKCGSVSGKVCDKFEQFGLTALGSRIVDAPIVDGCAYYLECKVNRYYPIIAIEFQDEYQGGTRWAFEADIVDSYGQEGYADMLVQ